MTFADIPTGTAVFIDSNTFVYHFIVEPTYGPACTEFLERVERQDVVGITSAHVLAEVAHRLMTIEACTQFQWPFQGIAARLRNHADSLQQLHLYRDALAEIEQLGMHILSVESRHVSEAAAVSQNHGLLTNDALIVALMRSQNLLDLASRDVDFDRVPGLRRFGPV